MRNCTIAIRIVALLTALLVPTVANAVVITQGYWTLGETGTIGTNNRPLDTSGNARHFANDQNGTGVSVSSAVDPRAAAIGSTNSYFWPATGARGFYGIAGAYNPPENNVGIELFARVTDTAGLTGDRTIFATGGGNGLKLQIVNGAWAASYDGVAFVGGTDPATINEWTHLALVRDSGVGRFYVDGVQVGLASLANPNDGNGPHLGVNSGGASGFFGNIDQVRLFTFNAGQFNAGSDLLIAIPEPATLIMVGAALTGLAIRRRRTA